jgi:hypothetical protein
MSEPTPVRRLGSDRVHLCHLGPTRPAHFIAPYTEAVPPVATLCRAVLRGSVVVMEEGTRVDCVTCKRLAA